MLMRPIILTTLFFSCIVSFGCSATVPIRTLAPGEHSLSVSLGGPMIELGSTIPVPYISTGYYAGATDELTIGANLHLIPVALRDIVVDASAIYRLHKQSDIPEITASLQIGLLSDLRSAKNLRCIPTIGINASQEIGSRLICFLGFENTFQIASPWYIVSPLVGMHYQFSHGFGMTLENKWMAANINTAHGIFEGAGSVGGQGDIAVFIGMDFGL
jgi:hypothetical protein